MRGADGTAERLKGAAVPGCCCTMTFYGGAAAACFFTGAFGLTMRSSFSHIIERNF